MIGKRSASMVHVAVGLLLACITFVLVARSIVILRFCRDGPITMVRLWYHKFHDAFRRDKQDERCPKPSKPYEKRWRNKRGLVPIMTPAYTPSPSVPSNQVDGNALDVKSDLLRTPL